MVGKRERDPSYYQFWRKQPRKGTATRRVLIEMLKPGGATVEEMVAKGVISKGSSLTNTVASLEDNFSWVITRERATKQRLEQCAGSRNYGIVYRATGKLKHMGRVVDYSRWSKHREAQDE